MASRCNMRLKSIGFGRGQLGAEDIKEIRLLKDFRRLLFVFTSWLINTDS